MITIKVPQNRTDKWSVSFGKGMRKRNNASVILNAIERSLPRLSMTQKLAIKVKYGKDSSNETVQSQDVSYLLWATSCFLEDYLTKKVLRRFEKVGGYL